RAGAGLDDAARYQLAAAGAAQRFGAPGLDLEAVGETLEGGVEIEARIDQRGPARERHAVLHLFRRPLVGHLLEFGIVVEDVAEIFGVVSAVGLDHGGGLYDFHHFGI